MKYWFIDAFTDEPFHGNPAVVCMLEKTLPDKIMAGIAKEMNLSETAFVAVEGDHFKLRWFTPKIEIKLCGHATLATARALRDLGIIKTPEIHFETLSGILTARYDNDWIELNFPVLPASESIPPEGLCNALGIATTPHWIGVNAHRNWIVDLGDENAVRALSPERSATMSLPVHGIIATARASTKPYDFVSRFFAPEAGVFEDPVTGSSHCALTPYWAERLGKKELVAYQASERGGSLRVRLEGDRVCIAGRSVIIARGDFAL
jgi:PhzF family phenazine biosynthesis protein